MENGSRSCQLLVAHASRPYQPEAGHWVFIKGKKFNFEDKKREFIADKKYDKMTWEDWLLMQQSKK